MADPRHGEMLIRAGGLDLGHSAVTPGIKDGSDHVDYDAVLDELREREVQAGQLDGEYSSDPVSISSMCPATSPLSSSYSVIEIHKGSCCSFTVISLASREK